MSFSKDYAIFLAKNSISKNQKNRVVRGLCRKNYQFLAALYCAISPSFISLQNLQEKGELVDTYPWPYREKWFADWAECGLKEGYTLVCDRAGFVIKHSTSYCAWKINELTGSWPERPRCMVSCDAKHWHQLLFHNYYRNTVKRPEAGKHYIGIAPSHGEHGEVVWFEGFDDGQTVERGLDGGGKIVYSTYRDKKFTIGAAPAEWYIWVEITTKK